MAAPGAAASPNAVHAVSGGDVGNAAGDRSHAIAAAIRQRGLEVKDPGEYIGMFEFCVWCAMRRRPLDLIFGRTRTAIAELHPFLGELVVGATQQQATVAACCWDEAMGDWKAVHDQYRDVVSHYVAAQRFQSSVPLAEAEIPRLKLQLKAMGYFMAATASQGDCGIDALVK